MGKATRWLRSLFRCKKIPIRSIGSGSGSHREKNGSGGLSYQELADADKHAIAVAAATAAVAEAAFAAAHAAAEVVRLTNESFGDGGSRGWYGGERRMEVAAVIIQSAFRAYLAKRALRALKALVKLQALVRGHIVRKQSEYMFHRMQAMLRAQARATAARAILSGSPHSSTRSSHFHHHLISSSTPKHRGLFSFVDENNDKILEVDTWKTRPDPTVSTKSDRHSYLTPTKPTSVFEVESTAENTPHAYSTMSKDGNICRRSNSARASRGEYSRSLFGDHARHPNYMSNTASSRAKLRSNSVPRRRILFESLGSTRQHWDCFDTNSERYY